MSSSHLCGYLNDDGRTRCQNLVAGPAPKPCWQHRHTGGRPGASQVLAAAASAQPARPPVLGVLTARDGDFEERDAGELARQQEKDRLRYPQTLADVAAIRPALESRYEALARTTVATGYGDLRVSFTDSDDRFTPARWARLSGTVTHRGKTYRMSMVEYGPRWRVEELVCVSHRAARSVDRRLYDRFGAAAEAAFDAGPGEAVARVQGLDAFAYDVRVTSQDGPDEPLTEGPWGSPVEDLRRAVLLFAAHERGEAGLVPVVEKLRGSGWAGSLEDLFAVAGDLTRG